MNAPRGAAAILLALAVLALPACAGRQARQGPPVADAGAHAAQPAAPPAGGGLYAPHIQDGAPGNAPDIASLPEPVPRPEPRARYGNHSPYTVLGRSYHVLQDARGYVERGIASWYGTKFHGRATSSLEPYDMYAFTAAHKTLPLPTWVRVTNLENGRSLVVRVNDRGPFAHDRLIDLSYAAAVRLGVHVKGTALVEVRALDPVDGEPPPPATVTARSDAPGDAGRAFVQVGSFADRGNAELLAGRLRDRLREPVRVEEALVGALRLFRVRFGPIDRSEALALQGRLAELGFGAATILSE